MDTDDNGQPEPLEVANEEDYKKLYMVMVNVFVQKAAGRLLQYPPPNLAEGDPYKISYTAEFSAADIRLLAKKLKIRLPRVKLIVAP
jgi:hypothetical protein